MKSKSLDQIQKEIYRLKEEQRRLEQESIELMSKVDGEGVYSFRPAGRHVLTIGEDLIQDQCAAVIELVKNAYDADSPSVSIVFSRISNGNVKISIQDMGHGMSLFDIVNKWLVPSTENKKEKRISPAGRIMQGRKGVGRYAASILGHEFGMKTVTKDGECNSVELDWNQFATVDYLDQVGVKISTQKVEESSGTIITMVGDSDQSAYWNDKSIQKLKFELKRLISPKHLENGEDFKIIFCFEKFYGDPRLDISEVIDPFPILELFDYRISGTVNKDGNGRLLYECQKLSPSAEEVIDFSYGKHTACGDLVFDIRVYDRDPDSIDTLIKRGLKDEKTGNYVAKNEAKRLLNEINGIGVFRNGFRIRPLGDPDYDWLWLNKKRIQNPSKKIGSDQVSGSVHIQSEELSGLEEKSARDGLKENNAYADLIAITNQVIERMEEKRFVLRRKLGLSQPKQALEKQLNSLYDYSRLKKTVDKTLKDAGLDDVAIAKVEKLIDEEEQKNNSTIEEIRKTVAIYQGQATIGKIINVLLHEGRRPLNYFKGQMPNLVFFEDKFKKTRDDNAAEKIVDISSGIEKNAQIFVGLFSRIDPLASKRRQNRKIIKIRSVLSGVYTLFENVLKKESISFEIKCNEQIGFNGWEQDFYAIFTNLVDNSIFWMKEKKSTDRRIRIDVASENEEFVINYWDSGPGISKDLLDSGVIFEPEFSTKPEGGSGLGLAIAGESAERNGLLLAAEESDCGVHFVITEREGD